mmetsp:Transcript_29251/g.93564  ORF Transcript_29251/g.93564 Transcript_29251/m.93564 type:complete len:237 (-) Transcript_29251:44-754(-)
MHVAVKATVTFPSASPSLAASIVTMMGSWYVEGRKRNVAGDTCSCARAARGGWAAPDMYTSSNVHSTSAMGLLERLISTSTASLPASAMARGVVIQLTSSPARTTSSPGTSSSVTLAARGGTDKPSKAGEVDATSTVTSTMRSPSATLLYGAHSSTATEKGSWLSGQGPMRKRTAPVMHAATPLLPVSVAFSALASRRRFQQPSSKPRSSATSSVEVRITSTSSPASGPTARGGLY